MFKFSKKIEYALIAAQYMAQNKSNDIFTAKEIADKKNISFVLLSKILQDLKKNNIIYSFQGVNGGYKLSKKSSEITLLELIRSVDQNSQLVCCAKPNANLADCEFIDSCSIRNPMLDIQKKVYKLFEKTKLSDLI
jgi:Rrf2 family protein